MLELFLSLAALVSSFLETKYEVWFTPKGQETRKYSEAATKEVADKVAAALKTAGTTEVRPVTTLKGAKTQTNPAQTGTAQTTPPQTGTGTGTAQNPPKTGTTPAQPTNLSGGAWWDANQAKYKASTKIEDLDKDWGPKLKEFTDALKAGGATVNITVGYRSQQRQYLMYYSAQIARGNMTAAEVDKLDKLGVDITWDHGDAAKSKKGAQEMLDKFGIGTNPVGKPTASNHTKGLAVDMNISWTGDLKIKKKDGTEVTIKSDPKSGLNSELWDVGDTYGVKKFEKYNKTADPPHWSSTGG